MNDKTERRRQLLGLLGDLPDRDAPLDVKVVAQDEIDGNPRESLLLDLNGLEPVPAYFIKPKETKGRPPVILYNHWHGGQYDVGKEQLFQPISGSVCAPWSEDLVKQGYAVLAIDHWVFGERRGRKESECFKEMLWNGRVMWGMMVFDSLRAVDYLRGRADVDPDRIGTLGMSMGSTMAWWLAALEPHVKVCVDICCLTDFHALIKAKDLDQHGVYYYVPGLLKHFSTTDINALVAPRPHLAIAGNFDRLTPTAGLDKLDAELATIYQRENAADAWEMIRYDIGHVETRAIRADALRFLKKWL